ncbi:hypothetical protein Hanom_Chr14g01248911 [Helianthus anomalus]
MRAQVWRSGPSVFVGPRSRDKRGFTKMTLTWATGVRFGYVTRRNDRENKAHLSTNTVGGLGHRSGPKTLISVSYLYFYVFSAFCGLLFRFSFWPKCVLRPVLNLRCYLYGCKGRKIISFEVYEKSFFSPNSLVSVLSVKPPIFGILRESTNFGRIVPGILCESTGPISYPIS